MAILKEIMLHFAGVSKTRGRGLKFFYFFFFYFIFFTFNSSSSIYQSVSCVRTDEYSIVRKRSISSFN